MKIDKTKAVSFTGYRTSKMLRSSDAPNLLTRVFEATYEAVKSLHSEGYDTFLSGMAEGFDMMAAEAVLRAKEEFPDIKLIAVIPFEGQELGYSPSDKQRYKMIFENADDVVFTQKRYTSDAYFVRNDFLLANCSCLVCYYSGMRGGTMYTVNRAVKMELSIINLALKKLKIKS